MSGLYIHIPFCRQACHYCDFHFSTNLTLKNRLVAALVGEIAMQKNYLPQKTLNSIYMGGGTPSLLTKQDLDLIFDAISTHFSIADGAEITLEANPDDLTEQKLDDLRQTPINRLSIGIQSFVEEDLKQMNRAHTTTQALRCVPLAQDKGFENLTLDLMYGLPNLTNAQWQSNLETAVGLGVNHVSGYCLTVEDKTALIHLIKKGSIKALDEEKCAKQFDILVNFLVQSGFNQYEISSFAKPNFEAVHNSNYWGQQPYLGIGPSAHSFDGKDTRQWNVANNTAYIEAIGSGKMPSTTEQLTPKNKFNERLMLGLRMQKGIDLNGIKTHFGQAFLEHLTHNLHNVNPLHYDVANQRLSLTPRGKLFADAVASTLFWV